MGSQTKIAEVSMTNPIRITGHVDENHRLFADVPISVPPGSVSVLIVPINEADDAGDAWMEGVAREWADDLNDARQDIYTLTDGEPVVES